MKNKPTPALGKAYQALLPWNDDTKSLIRTLRAHMAKDQKLVVRGAYAENGQKSPFHVKLSEATHVRLYFKLKDSHPVARNQQSNRAYQSSLEAKVGKLERSYILLKNKCSYAENYIDELKKTQERVSYLLDSITKII